MDSKSPGDDMRDLVNRGWKIVHDPGTAFVGMRHPNQGQFSLCEVKTTRGPLTLKEADHIASLIAEDLRARFNKQLNYPEIPERCQRGCS